MRPTAFRVFRAGASLVLLSLATGGTLLAQNFPPIAKATPIPEEVLLGQPIVFSSVESIDPDEAPQPMSFLWDFGDGRTSISANPSHTYTARGQSVNLRTRRALKQKQTKQKESNRT